MANADARRVRLKALVAALIVVAGASCADFDAPEVPELPDVVVATPSYAANVQPIFTARCAVSSCHTPATHQIDLRLDSLHSYGDLVGVPSALGAFDATHTMLRVKPFDVDSSWLVRMIDADPARRFHNVRMPLGRTPLTENQIQTIRNWIAQGALHN